MRPLQPQHVKPCPLLPRIWSTAQCGAVTYPPPHSPTIGQPKMRKSWLIRGGGAAQYLGKMKDNARKKGAHELCQLPTSLAAFTEQFREEKAFLHLKLNIAKPYTQEASPNYTHRVMETQKKQLCCSIDRATTSRCCSAVAADIKMEKC